MWIDFYEIGHIDHPFRLDFQYFISSVTFRDEFLKSQDMRNDLVKYGLQLTDVTVEEFTDALKYKDCYPQLSVYDTFALAIAKRRNWVLLTGDRPLRNAANKEGIEYHGVIWIYDQLKAQGKMVEAEYSAVIDDLIVAVNSGRCRLPMDELVKRKAL